jgi:hypothetical protein
MKNILPPKDIFSLHRVSAMTFPPWQRTFRRWLSREVAARFSIYFRYQWPSKKPSSAADREGRLPGRNEAEENIFDRKKRRENESWADNGF